MQKENLSPAEIDTIMNKKSGILGVSQKTSDNRDIEEGARNGDARCKLIENMICHQLTKYVGGYAAAMGGVDAVVFTAGIGENNKTLRHDVLEDMSYLGIKYNSELNDKAPRGEFCDLTAEGSKVKVFVIPTNEEYMIALDTLNLAK